jgi:hypothetical protein
LHLGITDSLSILVSEHLIEFSEGILLFLFISLHHVDLLEVIFILTTLIISLSLVHIGIRHVIFILVVVSVESIDVFNFIASYRSFITSALSIICFSVSRVRWVIKSVRIFFSAAISVHHVAVLEVSLSFRLRLSISTFSLSCICFRNVLIFLFLAL